VSLKTAARTFVREVFRALEPKVAEKQAEPAPMPTWERVGGEVFALRRKMLSAEEWCLIDEVRRDADLPQQGRMDAALQNDSRVAPLLNRLVGTPLASMLIDEDGLRRELLWSVMRAGNVSLEFSDDAFNHGYDAWLGSTLAPTQRAVVLAPLSLRFEDRVDLGDGLEIAQLDDEEVGACLTMGAIRVTLPTGGSDTAWVRNTAAIRRAYTLPRGPSDAFTEQDVSRANDVENTAVGACDEVVEALRVFQRGRVAITGHVLLRGDGSMSGGPSATPRFAEQDELVLTAPEDFRPFWTVFRSSRGNSALAAVTRRFGYAGDRARRDDEIVDLIAALEALLLSDIPDRTELRFRTALRGALFIDENQLTPREIQRQLRRGYDVRSAVSHGAAPSNDHLRSATGEPVTLDEFVEEIEELVRQAVRKAIQAVGAGEGWPPDWDALTLEGATYPA
jgi:hypothetical protein